MNGTIESEKANNLTIDDICDEDIDMSNAEVEDGFSPRMYPAKKRRALLKLEGVKKIDKSEKYELNEIRKSREQCGCDCQDFCDPETCSCTLAGIKCQVSAAEYVKCSHSCYVHLFSGLCGIDPLGPNACFEIVASIRLLTPLLWQWVQWCSKE